MAERTTANKHPKARTKQADTLPNVCRAWTPPWQKVLAAVIAVSSESEYSYRVCRAPSRPALQSWFPCKIGCGKSTNKSVAAYSEDRNDPLHCYAIKHSLLSSFGRLLGQVSPPRLQLATGLLLRALPQSASDSGNPFSWSDGPSLLMDEQSKATSVSIKSRRTEGC